MDFTQFKDSPTIFTGSGQGSQAFSNPNDFFSAGGKQDFSNVTKVNSATPAYLKSAQIFTPVSAKPSSTIPSSSLTQTPSTQFDLIGALNKNLSNQDSILNNINSYFTPSDQELAAQKQYNDLQNQTDSTNLNALAGINQIQDKPIPMDFVTGQQSAVQRQANLALQTLGVQQQAAARNLQNLQANRQTKLQAAQFMYDANRNSLQDTLNIYQQTAPQNIGTQVNQETGDVYVLTKNPVTGEVVTQKAGNVGAQKAYSSTQTIQGADGQYYFLGIKPDGTKEVTPLGVQGKSENQQFTQIGETVDAYGNKIPQYGFVNNQTGAITPVNNANQGANLGTPQGTIMGLPAYDTAANNPGVTRSNRNNNPGNIKATSTSVNYPGVVGVESRAAADGGNFLIFASPQDGLNAVGQLLQSGKAYQGVTAEKAIKSYNGNGSYGAKDVGLNPNQSFQAQISNPQTLQTVVQNIARLEGFNAQSNSPAGFVGPLNPNAQQQSQAVSPIDNELRSWAATYADSGNISAAPDYIKKQFSKIQEYAKELPKPTGALVSNNTGVKPSNLAATQADGISALYDLQNKLDQAKTLFDSYNHGLLAGVKNSILPSQTAQQYNALRGEIVDLLARARTGAAINASEEKLYASKMPGDFNKFLFLGSSGDTSIDSLKNSLAGKLDSTLKNQGLSIYGYSKVKVGGQQYTVGDIVQNSNGQTGRVNPDGSITLINQ